jgi:hypothetical protein
LGKRRIEARTTVSETVTTPSGLSASATAELSASAASEDEEEQVAGLLLDERRSRTRPWRESGSAWWLGEEKRGGRWRRWWGKWRVRVSDKSGVLGFGRASRM